MDFYQPDTIATLHCLGKVDIEVLEGELAQYSRRRPIALVLPALFSDLESAAMKGIFEELSRVGYVSQIVCTLAQADERQFKKARRMFTDLPHETKVIWNDGKRLQSIYHLLEENGISAGGDGKGRSAWMAYGYVLASGRCSIIALHDCDIVTYSRILLARLCYPTVNPNLDYEFCKGYYARVTDRMHGRVTRIFVIPLIRALKSVFGPKHFLDYLDNFRYPLAGEFSMSADLARINRIPGDWGLEVGVLAEVYRNCATRRICQVDLCENYEHKHQPLSPEDPGTGLMKMAVDIAKTIFRNMAEEGAVFSEANFKTLCASYLKLAREMTKKYSDDSAINGLNFDLHLEGSTIEAFTNALEMASEAYMEDPLGRPMIPNWNRVTSAIPNFFDILMDAVETDLSEA